MIEKGLVQTPFLAMFLLFRRKEFKKDMRSEFEQKPGYIQGDSRKGPEQINHYTKEWEMVLRGAKCMVPCCCPRSWG